ncbi:ferrochelatase [Rhodovibrio salinarum]|uniref:Ferrochelatase n=1 Tax=Rhodovibrio salinarum TaxID=1087 RepID=A0A934V1M3_9PROT|nr:ferrochelatase [Rhodovibrio salinarum]MBK1698606.1 ferrochelatase [Rhodovibrio salinarum]
MAERSDNTREDGEPVYQTDFPSEHPPIGSEKVGVLLLNLGTPEGTDYWSMRRYLKEFLSDQRVIELNPVFWQILLNTVILSKRPQASGKAYASIWNTEKNESPLKTITRDQSDAVAGILQQRFGGEVVVDWAMRYGYPRTQDVLAKLEDQGCHKILLLALYPQYAASTTATAYDQAFRALMRMRWQPAIRTTPSYHDEPQYIDAVVGSIQQHLQQLDWTPEVLVTSFHGLPKRYLLNGDPYHCQCAKSSRLIRDRLGWSAEAVQLSFQSRFGKEEWLQPYTDEKLAQLAREGVKKVAIIAPGFASDCVETLEELDQEGRETFLEAGGEQFTYIPCLNAQPDHVRLIADLATRELGGWVDDNARGRASIAAE